MLLALARARPPPTAGEKRYAMQQCLQHLGYSSKGVKQFLDSPYQSLEDLVGSSSNPVDLNDNDVALKAVREAEPEATQRLRALRWWAWFNRQRGVEEIQGNDFDANMQVYFAQYDQERSREAEAEAMVTPPFVFEEYSDWFPWENQMRRYLSQHRGVTGLPLSYVARRYKVGKEPLPELDRSMTVDAVLEATACLPRDAVLKAKMPWFQHDSERVYALMVPFISARQLGVLTAQSTRLIKDGHGLWRQMEKTARQNETLGIVCKRNERTPGGLPGNLHDWIAEYEKEQRAEAELIPHAAPVPRQEVEVTTGRLADGVYLTEEDTTSLRAALAISSRRPWVADIEFRKYVDADHMRELDYQLANPPDPVRVAALEREQMIERALAYSRAQAPRRAKRDFYSMSSDDESPSPKKAMVAR